MKISASKKQLAKIISENGGWLCADFAAQQDDGEVWFSSTKPTWNVGRGTFAMGYKDHFTIGNLIANRHQSVLSRDEYFHLYPAPDADGWIEWKGGDQPVKDGVKVDVKYKTSGTNIGVRAGFTGRLNEGSMSGYSAVKWSHTGSRTDIIAYRLHKPNLAETEFCESVTRSIPEPSNKPTIEQLAADYRNAKDYAERKQQEADEAKVEAEAALSRLIIACADLGFEIKPKVKLESSGSSVIDKLQDKASALAGSELNITDWRDLQVGDEIKVFDFECPEDSAERKKELMGGVCVVMSARDGVVHIERKDNIPKKGLYWNATGVDACEFTFIRRPAKGYANA